MWLAEDVSASDRPHVRAPEFGPGTWFNTAAPLTLRALRGKVVLIDFWTFCCGNCLHVIDELRSLERDFSDVLVIVGVHSPKFEHEKSDAAVRAATERYEVDHPVLNDPDLYLWRQYAIRAWPTLVLVDPNGYVIAQAAGEGQAVNLRPMIEALVAQHDAAGTLVRGDNPYLAPAPEPGDLRFPAKAVRHGADLYVADAGHHQIVRMSADGQTVLERIGSGRRGAGPDEFAEPNGVATVPDGVTPLTGFHLIVADTANHVLRGIRIDHGGGRIVRTIDLPAALAGTQTITGEVPAVLSPWDVAWWPAARRFVVAAAGVHLLLAWDPASDQVELLAGTTVEGLKDGAALDAWLAQPSGLAADGDRMWFVDSETSSLRWLDLDGTVHTAVGVGLFDFGHVDGAASQARFQHPLGVAVGRDGSVLVADTYNGAVRRYDRSAAAVGTIASDLVEPSGIVSDVAGLLVVESGGHRIVAVADAAPSGTGGDFGERMHTDRPVTAIAAGPLLLSVPFIPAPGRKLDNRYGPSTNLTVSASPAALLLDGGGPGTELSRTLLLGGQPGDTGVLQVTAQAASCDGDLSVQHPACYLARQDWGIPIVISDDGVKTLELPLLG
jgi:thiol-disulfide isomerase/thioredoxin